MFLRLINPKFILVVILVIIFPFIAYNLTKSPSKKVLSGNIENLTVPTPSVQSSPSPVQSPSSSPKIKLSKSTYTIAVYGDSMVDTMGENLDYLQKSLSAKYPGTIFKLYNYGIGGQNVMQGVERWGKPFSYQTRNYPPISQLNADVIILGSFAYNPFPTHDKIRHLNTLTQLSEAAKKTKANVYLLCEIGPLKDGFGKGTNGVNWPEDVTMIHVGHIIEQLENVITLSNLSKTPLISAYKESKVDAVYGSRAYVDGNDGIHPSVQGHVLMANLIARTLELK